MPVRTRCQRRRRLLASSTAKGLLCACCCLSLAVCTTLAAQRTTVCATQRPQLLCSHGERIVIRKLLHSFDPNPCLTPHPDNNCTTEDGEHLKEVISECYGKTSCSINPPPEDDDDDYGPQAPAYCLINHAVHVNRKEKFNYADVRYDCESDTFCTVVSRQGPYRAVIRTPSYPAPTAPTSSSCECQFSINNREAKMLKAHVTCPNSTVRFRWESASQYSETSLKESGERLCEKVGDGSPLELVTVLSHLNLIVSVDEDGSDERSAYGVIVTAIRHSKVPDSTLPVSVSCKGATVIFTKTEKIIIGVTVPCLVIIIVLVIIALKIACKRRKSRQRSTANAAESTVVERNCGDGSAESDDGARRYVVAAAPAAVGSEHADYDGRSISSAASAAIARSSSTRRSSNRKDMHAAERLSKDPSNADLVAFAVRLHNRKLLEADGVASLRSSQRSGSLRSAALCGPASLLLNSSGGSYQQLGDISTPIYSMPRHRLPTLPHSSAAHSCSPPSRAAAAAATSSDGAAAAATQAPSSRMQPSAQPRPSGPPPPVPSPPTVPPLSQTECCSGSVDVVPSAERPKQAATRKPLPPPKPSKLTLAVAQAARPASTLS